MAKVFQFSKYLKTQSWSAHTDSLRKVGPSAVETALSREGKGGVTDLLALLSPWQGSDTWKILPN